MQGRTRIPWVHAPLGYLCFHVVAPSRLCGGQKKGPIRSRITAGMNRPGFSDTDGGVISALSPAWGRGMVVRQRLIEFDGLLFLDGDDPAVLKSD